MPTLIKTGTLRTVIQVMSGGIVRESEAFVAGTDPQVIKQYIHDNGGRVMTDMILLESEGLQHSGQQRMIVPNDIDIDAQVGSLDRSKWTSHPTATRIITLAR